MSEYNTALFLDYKEYHSLSKRCLAFTPGLTKMTQLDVLLYVRDYDVLETMMDHFDTIETSCACHKVMLVYLENEYNHENYLLSRMFNFDYATGIGFPLDAVTSNSLPGIAMLGLKAEGKECPRCWNLHDGSDLCSRCEKALNQN